MGLDTVAAKALGERISQEDRDAFEAAGIELCQGMITLGQVHAFRGKVYDSLVEAVTGETLYDAWIAPETVRKMSVALDRCDPARLVADGEAESERDVIELRKFFRVCRERGLGLVGSF